MKRITGPYPAFTVDGGGSIVLAHAGATLLLRTAQTVGLTSGPSGALAPWRRPLAVHDPAKIVLDLAIGGDCLADIAELRLPGSVRARGFRSDGVAVHRRAGR